MNRIEKVLMYLNEMNFEPNLYKFKDKLVVQKVICLLGLMGIDTGYRSTFSLYVRGPYSPALTKELYKNRDKINIKNSKNIKNKTEYNLTKKEKEQLSKLYEISDHLNPDILEIMSTYAYLVKEGKNDEKTAINNLRRLKSFYPESKLAVGISKTKELFLKLSEDEIKDIKHEFKDWENASVLNEGE